MPVGHGPCVLVHVGQPGPGIVQVGQPVQVGLGLGGFVRGEVAVGVLRGGVVLRWGGLDVS
ncbi:hypothetical protein VV02_00465 [Luteipulveratus mongoliensis]|uniref:Uncharacterized protein n=1 Tax=Luteipulveratus mongoliensis TaxID=571913 RepID=A0A0K1JDC5_9MICO|nr:hypothetical protein VV02_00465 [Luteipulveratus mongoliensis]